jgi:hypothetical protein
MYSLEQVSTREDMFDVYLYFLAIRIIVLKSGNDSGASISPNDLLQVKANTLRSINEASDFSSSQALVSVIFFFYMTQTLLLGDLG